MRNFTIDLLKDFILDFANSHSGKSEKRVLSETAGVVLAENLGPFGDFPITVVSAVVAVESALGVQTVGREGEVKGFTFNGEDDNELPRTKVREASVIQDLNFHGSPFTWQQVASCLWLGQSLFQPVNTECCG
jgi:hypothetical protein